MLHAKFDECATTAISYCDREGKKEKKIRQIIGRISPAWRSGVRGLIPFVGENYSEHATSSAMIIFLLPS
jgi:hypothetical protein